MSLYDKFPALFSVISLFKIGFLRNLLLITLINIIKCLSSTHNFKVWCPNVGISFVGFYYNSSQGKKNFIELEPKKLLY